MNKPAPLFEEFQEQVYKLSEEIEQTCERGNYSTDVRMAAHVGCYVRAFRKLGLPTHTFQLALERTLIQMQKDKDASDPK